MYCNIGKKIKGLAVFFCVIGIIAQIILGIVCILVGNGLLSALANSYPALRQITSGTVTAGGIVVMVIGSIITWISTWLLYGYGELIDKVCDIEDGMYYMKR
ncbi:MAG TPA: hypothetical protein DDY70_03210 [Clostridiales bacterium]|nr:hypothetical protein [Clostridiales bacterium]